MKSLKILSLAVITFLLTATETKASRNFDADNPPNPLDAKSVSMEIINKTNENIKVSFFLNGKKQFHGIVISSGKSETFNIDGRYNKKNAYFRFRKAEIKGGDVRFYYKKIAKARGIKLDTIYLLQNNDIFIISATEKYEPSTIIMQTKMSEL